MKLYHFPPAPNPAKLGFYLREKGIEVETELLDFRKGEQNSPEHLARNPAGTLPVLELDDGTCLVESLAIIEYLEEVYPDPPMLGTTALERAQVRAVMMYIELNLLLPMIRWVHTTKSPLGLPPNPAVANHSAERLPRALQRVNDRIGSSDFVMGDRPTVPDCILLAALNFGQFADFELPDGLDNLSRWYELYPLRHL